MDSFTEERHQWRCEGKWYPGHMIFSSVLISVLSCVPTACLSTDFFRCSRIFPVFETGRIDMARGLVSASVVSRVVAVNSLHIKEARRRHCIRSLERCRDICKATCHRNGTSVRIPTTTVHKCKPRATPSLAKPHAFGTRFQQV
ncbi:hypothetical protein AVEN_160000-1 [Araneus ventricosus]|uniref:Uncharacterized protein n=1 Tax=Araneus ventricosus TaxID=182803 RepID=A0A4Y2Q9V4_ARAVE|nr:hypothetical protein AVEN_160000-1 [Araneus ventricosus]